MIPLLAINDGSPPFRCPDCLHESATPIEFLTHLGSDHVILAQGEDESFQMNPTIFPPNAIISREHLEKIEREEPTAPTDSDLR